MHPYVVFLILSSLLTALLAGAVLSFRPTRHEGRLAATLLGCGAFWTLMQAMWCSASEAETALFMVRLASLGWLPIPALAFHLLVRSVPHTRPFLRRAIPVAYAGTAAILALDWTTPLVHRSVQRTSWGWAYALDQGFLVIYAWLVIVSLPVIWLAYHGFRSSPSPAERSQNSVIGLGLVVPLVVASITDGVLPLMGIPFPYLGGISIAFLAMIGAVSSWRYGYSVLVPTHFAPEILDTLPEGVAMAHLDGRIRSCNRGLSELTGYPPRSLEQMPLQEIVTPSLETLLEGVRDLECELVRASGRRVPVSVSADTLRDRRDLPIGIVVVVHDQRELVGLRNRLLVSGRLAAVGELAAGVAHEINNPLAYVRSNLSLLESHVKILQDHLRDEPSGADPALSGARRDHAMEIARESGELVAEGLEGMERAASIVRDIKGLAHAGSGEQETVDLHDLLDAVLRVASPQLGAGVVVERAFGQLPLIQCSPQELKQVFLNLVVNAAQAMRGMGRIRVETAGDPEWVRVRVIDDGEGIAPEHVDRIFDPFFTTKPVGEGTGLGLAISWEIVRRHAGELLAERPEEGGACFEVRLPVRVADSQPLP